MCTIDSDDDMVVSSPQKPAPSRRKLPAAEKSKKRETPPAAKAKSKGRQAKGKAAGKGACLSRVCRQQTCIAGPNLSMTCKYNVLVSLDGW